MQLSWKASDAKGAVTSELELEAAASADLHAPGAAHASKACSTARDIQHSNMQHWCRPHRCTTVLCVATVAPTASLMSLAWWDLVCLSLGCCRAGPTAAGQLEILILEPLTAAEMSTGNALDNVCAYQPPFRTTAVGRLRKSEGGVSTSSLDKHKTTSLNAFPQHSSATSTLRRFAATVVIR